VVEGKNGFVDAPKPLMEKLRPALPDTLTCESVSPVDMLSADGEIFAGLVDWMVKAIQE
jgi:hypothetical protein